MCSLFMHCIESADLPANNIYRYLIIALQCTVDNIGTPHSKSREHAGTYEIPDRINPHRERSNEGYLAIKS